MVAKLVPSCIIPAILLGVALMLSGCGSESCDPECSCGQSGTIVLFVCACKKTDVEPSKKDKEYSEKKRKECESTTGVTLLPWAKKHEQRDQHYRK